MSGVKRRRSPIYHGWFVVAAAFLVAFFAFGLGFYGPGVYLVALEEEKGWPIPEISAAITLYYLAAAILVYFAGRLILKIGLRRTIVFGTISMVTGLLVLSSVTHKTHVFLAFLIMSLGWACLSGAAINFIIAPWFEARRGFAMSLALTGANTGGAVMAPLLIALFGVAGFTTSLRVMAAVMFVIVVPTVLVVLRPRRADERDIFDAASQQTKSSNSEVTEDHPRFRIADTLKQGRFLTTAIPFAGAFFATVAFLTHQVAFLSAEMGTIAAGWAVTVTTAVAVLGRLATGLFIDRFDQRVASCAIFLLQAFGLLAIIMTPAPWIYFLACGFFGLGLGNLAMFPGLLVQREFPRYHFIPVLSLIVAIYQFTYAFGPWVIGELRELTDSYRLAFLCCVGVYLAAAVLVSYPLFRSGVVARAEG